MEEKNLVSSETLSKILNISVRRIQQLSKDNTIPKSQKGKYPFMPSIMRYIVYLQELTRGKKINPEDLEIEKIRKLRAESNLLELELQKKQKTLLQADEVSEELHKMVGNFREQLLAIPPRISPKLTNLNKEEKIREIIENVLYESMKVMETYEPQKKDDMENI